MYIYIFCRPVNAPLSPLINDYRTRTPHQPSHKHTHTREPNIYTRNERQQQRGEVATAMTKRQSPKYNRTRQHTHYPTQILHAYINLFELTQKKTTIYIYISTHLHTRASKKCIFLLSAEHKTGSILCAIRRNNREREDVEGALYFLVVDDC